MVDLLDRRGSFEIDVAIAATAEADLTQPPNSPATTPQRPTQPHHVFSRPSINEGAEMPPQRRVASTGGPCLRTLPDNFWTPRR